MRQLPFKSRGAAEAVSHPLYPLVGPNASGHRGPPDSRMSGLISTVTGTPKFGSYAVAVASTCAGPALNGAPLAATRTDQGFAVGEHCVERVKKPVASACRETRWVTVPERCTVVACEGSMVHSRVTVHPDPLHRFCSLDIEVNCEWWWWIYGLNLTEQGGVRFPAVLFKGRMKPLHASRETSWIVIKKREGFLEARFALAIYQS